MINVLGLEQYDKDTITESYDLLAEKYNTEIENESIEAFTNRLVGTRIIDEYSTVSIKNVVKIDTGASVFYILSIYVADIPERVAPWVLMYGVAMLKKESDKIFIRPKTLLDTMGNIFSKTKDLFVSYKGNYNKYCLYVKENAIMDKKPVSDFLKEVGKMDKYYAQVTGDMIIATPHKLINATDTLGLAEFMAKVIAMFA